MNKGNKENKGNKKETIPPGHITVTDAARDYLADLLSKKEEKTGVRVFITQAGTPHAETCLAYCPAGDEEEDDVLLEEIPFDFFIEKTSIDYLHEAFIDFNKDEFGGQLTIRAPNSKMMHIDENSPMGDRVNYVLYTEINPALASHGGMVSLAAMEEKETIAVLRFGGGCQGCGMIDVTLKQGVEKTLLEKVQGLRGIRDATDHSDRTNAYY